MSLPLLTLRVRHEDDLVQARNRARQVAALVGLPLQEQTRLATAVSEIARNALVYGGGGTVEFLVDEAARPPLLLARIADRGPGIKNLKDILAGQFQSRSGMGLGIIGSKRLMDSFHIESSPGAGTIVTLGKALPTGAAAFTAADAARVSAELARQSPSSPLEELKQQNQELLAALAELRAHQEELARVNHELAETNRGVVSLYAELDEKTQRIQTSLMEKEVLLKEIHHRVKNNLQIVISLLRLQSRQITEPVYIAMLKDIQSRIRVMALIHEKLYGTADFARIDFKEYVQGLAESVLTTYDTSEGRITFSLEGGSVFVNMEQAIPCGLIINELITNAIKYAFPGDSKGEIAILLREPADREIEIIVRDNGVGLPEQFDPGEAKTLGMQLVTALVEEQLKGRLTLARDKGTEFSFRFKA